MSWFSHLKLKSMLFIECMILTAFTIAVGIIGYVSINHMSDADTVLYIEGVESLHVAGNMGQEFAIRRSSLRDLCIETEPAANQKYKDSIDASKAKLDKSMEELLSYSKNNPQNMLHANEVSNSMNEYFKASEIIIDLAMANRNAEAIQYMKTTAVPASEKFKDALGKLETYMLEAANAQMEKNKKTTKDADTTMIICVTAAILFSVMLGTYIVNLIVRRLRNLLSTVNENVEGVSNGSVRLSHMSEQMSKTTSQIAKGAENQRVDAERMAGAMTELSASIDEVNRDNQNILSRLESAMEATKNGNEAGLSTKEAMNGIKRTTTNIAQAIGLIQDIANRTNLLSLNAAIEAAKAGELGKGFAVVAEEVRKLAERSTESSKDIARHNIESTQSVQRGQEMVDTTVELLNQIKESLNHFATQTRTAVNASAEQSKAGAEVTKLVETSVAEATSIASASKEIFNTTDEVAHTAAELAKLANTLKIHMAEVQTDLGI